MIVTIIGLGLIGGSIAIDLKKSGFAEKIIGVDHSQINSEFAKQIGFVDEVKDLNEAIDESRLIILAIPADGAVKVLPKILNQIDEQVITDVCSTKVPLKTIIEKHPKREQVVLAHPMAGTEFSGPWAAKQGLFDGKACILCDLEENNDRAKQTVIELFETLNMRLLKMGSEEHDMHAAYVSHISHISSFALALTVLEKEKDENRIFDLASGGFDSTVRLAKSNAEMWSPIFRQNKENILTVLDTYIDELREFKQAIESDDSKRIHQKITEANRIKKVLS